MDGVIMELLLQKIEINVINIFLFVHVFLFNILTPFSLLLDY